LTNVALYISFVLIGATVPAPREGLQPAE